MSTTDFSFSYPHDRLLKSSGLGLVEAAGVELAYSIENRQVVESVNICIGAIFRIAKSTVRSLYGPFPEIQQVPNSTFGRPL